MSKKRFLHLCVTVMFIFATTMYIQADAWAMPFLDNGDFVWVKSMGGPNDERGYDITIDSSGDVYSTGHFVDTADFDPGPGTYQLTSSGDKDIFISKLDSNGNFIWAKRMGGVNYDQGNSISVDASGNVYVTGVFLGTADFDPGAGTFNLTSSGMFDIFVSKLDSSGNFVWAKSIGGIYDDFGSSIALDESGNIYTTGSFLGTVDFDPGTDTFNLTSAQDAAYFISKLDSNGNFIWAKRMMGGLYHDVSSSITLDLSGNIYMTGKYFLATANIDVGAGVINPSAPPPIGDIIVSKLDNSGNVLWTKIVGGPTEDFGTNIAIDSSNNVYVIGDFEGTVDFDPGPGTFNLTSAPPWIADIFILKLDVNGSFIWARSMGGVDYELGNSIAVDTSGNIYTTGRFSGTADFDPGPGTFDLNSAGIPDIFVSMLNNNGNFVWAKSMGGPEWDEGNSITLDSSENIYVVGAFKNTVDFDPGMGIFNLTSVGGSDIFISKFEGAKTFNIMIASNSMGSYGIPYNGTVRHNYTGVDNAPVKVASTDGTTPLLVSERFIYSFLDSKSYGEIMGYPGDQLATEYWFPWYNNVSYSTQLRVSNMGNNSAEVKVYVGNSTIPIDTFTLIAGQGIRMSYTGLDDGPLHVVSTDSVTPILASERFIQTFINSASYAEMMGYPGDQLVTEYWFPWYNNLSYSTQLRVSNLGGTNAEIEVYVGNSITPIDAFTLSAGQGARKSYAVDNGPLHVVSTDGVTPILASERFIQTFGTSASYAEMMGYPGDQLTTEYCFPSYNNIGDGELVLSSQLRVSNMGGTSAQVKVYLANNEIDSFTLLTGQGVRKTYPYYNSGPLCAKSTDGVTPILASERFISTYLSSASYSEMIGYRRDRLMDEYYFPWYNNVNYSTELIVAKP